VTLCVALVFRRKSAPMQPKRLLVIDFNALNNGILWAVLEERRIVAKGILRPNVSRITHMQRVVARLDSLCAEKDEICDMASAAKSRMWRLLRSWEDEAVKKLVHLAVQYRAAVVADVPKDSSMRVLKEGNHKSEKKVFLNLGSIRRKLQGFTMWCGVPYREKRLYSTVCPHCGGKMMALPNRRVKCICGFEARRDDVPIFWAIKLYPQLISFSSSASGNCLERFSGGAAASVMPSEGAPAAGCPCSAALTSDKPAAWSWKKKNKGGKRGQQARHPHFSASPSYCGLAAPERLADAFLHHLMRLPLLRAGLLPAPAHGPRSLLETSSNTSPCASTSAASTRAKRKPGGCSASSEALVP